MDKQIEQRTEVRRSCLFLLNELINWLRVIFLVPLSRVGCSGCFLFYGLVVSVLSSMGVFSLRFSWQMVHS